MAKFDKKLVVDFSPRTHVPLCLAKYEYLLVLVLCTILPDCSSCQNIHKLTECCSKLWTGLVKYCEVNQEISLKFPS